MHYMESVDGNMLMVNQGNCRRWFICTTCSSSRPCHPALSLIGRTSQLPARSRPSCSWLQISKYGWKIQTTHLACSRTPCKFAVPSIKTDRQKTRPTPQTLKSRWNWSRRCAVKNVYYSNTLWLFEPNSLTSISREIISNVSSNKMYQFMKSLPW